MRSDWSPSVVPAGVHDTVYLVVDCSSSGCVWREADIAGTDLETVIKDLLAGEYSDPLCVIAFNATENWSRDVTADIAREIQERSDLAYEDIPSWLEDFVHRHVSPEVQLPLRLR
ncbi:hypothetical protein RPMA_18240 [Tardiphaga alba]|uniref:VWFA domain-containing protein n=1 Tax=Tardiphaga alba TaxID=340268 RepID=A0ABX8AA86_9BRAD|nr:hypothetical protein [Tardiphaga alba]QUS40558.1 hypothetical protein RPMA_18240 [Tardiphaga alba]